MTDAYDAMVAKRSTRPIYLLTIEALGDATNGQYKFCTRVPDYAVEAGDDAYKPLLVDIPKETTSELKPFIGGVTKRNVLSFEMLDVQEYEHDPGLLTRLSPTDALHTDEMLRGTKLKVDGTWLKGSLVSPASDVWQEDMLVFMNSECMKIVRKIPSSGVPSLEIERGMLGTTARSHDTTKGSVYMFTNNQVLKRRKVRLYATYDGLSSVDEKLLGTYRVMSLDIDGASWQFGASTSEDRLDAAIYGSATLVSGKLSGWGRHEIVLSDGIISNIMPHGHKAFFSVVDTQNQLRDFDLHAADWWSNIPKNNPEWNGAWIDVKGEYMQGKWAGAAPFPDFIVFRRERLGTGDIDYLDPLSWELKDAEFKEVFTTRIESPGDVFPELAGTSFRYQKKGEETTSLEDTWHCTEHPIHIMLCLMCSAREPGDGVALTNYVSGQGNFSACRPGLGLGIPASEIDFDSFWKVFEADPSLKLPFLVIDAPEKFSDWVTKNILKPFGWCLMVDELEKLSLKVFKSGMGISVQGDDIGVDDIIIKEGSPMIKHSRTIEDSLSSIKLSTREPSGANHVVIYNSTQFSNLYTFLGESDETLNQLSIDIPGADEALLNSPALHDRCEGLLRRFRKPIDRVTFSTDMRFKNRNVGAVFFLTIPWLIDFSTGTRGFIDVPVQIVQRRLNFKEGTIEWVGIAWFGERLKPIAPSVLISKVGDGVFDTVTNAFGTSDDTFGSPKDSLAFEPGDIVRLLETDNTIVAGSSTSTVVSNENGKLKLSGDFNVKARNGMLISLAHSEDASEDMLANRAYLASRKTGVVQEGTSPARFGRPLLED